MKGSLLIVALLLVSTVVVAAAQQYMQPPSTPQPYGRPWSEDEQTVQPPMGMGGGQGMTCPCAMCQMGGRGAMGTQMESRMRQAGMPEETVGQAKMLMRARIHPADPQALMALKDELNLTDAQVGNLERVIDSAQERALGILTPDQWQRVRLMKPQAMSMMEMHQSIMPQMRAMRGMRGRGMPMSPDEGMMERQPTPPYGRPHQQGSACPPSADK